MFVRVQPFSDPRSPSPHTIPHSVCQCVCMCVCVCVELTNNIVHKTRAKDSTLCVCSCVCSCAGMAYSPMTLFTKRMARVDPYAIAGTRAPMSVSTNRSKPNTTCDTHTHTHTPHTWHSQYTLDCGVDRTAYGAQHGAISCLLPPAIHAA